MPKIVIRPLEVGDIAALAPVECAAWHDAYQSYDFYAAVAPSVTEEKVAKNWRDFLSAEEDEAHTLGLVSGGDRVAMVALDGKRMVGAGAASSYKEGVWQPVDALLKERNGGALPKVAKFQSLYIDPQYRGQRIGPQLGVARAKMLLAKGYTQMMTTTYAEAAHANAYHAKHGLEKVYAYDSHTQYAGGVRVKIACWLHEDLEALCATWEGLLAAK